MITAQASQLFGNDRHVEADCPEAVLPDRDEQDGRDALSHGNNGIAAKRQKCGLPKIADLFGRFHR